ncbi:hypothetical protein [Pseudaminobacter soli (ex Li et al. 2025)]|uniref:Uncharacterized protein n=1 Tax=Pseudaminobacter soli (ex Li et al. 2025) TaxID=1295366 RepID=A0A2P7SG93_9HYPH|nr:hypothetical protein [Mesorhizobium soli]PSJ61512.1 hypothetical protein C7I85_10710 [Mesorhizobium soli]
MNGIHRNSAALRLINHRKIRTIAAVVMGLGLAASIGTSAYAKDCALRLPLSSVRNHQAAGTVASARGQVNVLGPNQGWAPASVGTPIALGGAVETGPVSRASLAVGQHRLDLKPRMQATFTTEGERLCVVLSETDPSGVVGAGNGTALIVGGAAVALGIGAALATSTGDDTKPLSP